MYESELQDEEKIDQDVIKAEEKVEQEVIKVEEKPKEKSIVIQRKPESNILNSLKFDVESQNNVKERIQVGEKVEWNIKIINTGADFPTEMELYD